MRARDAATARLDGVVESVATDSATPGELFAVVDLLDDSPALRRSLSDPSASEEQRAGLARRLLQGKVAEATLAVVTAVAQAPWGSGHAFVGAVERQGIRLALRSAALAGALPRVSEELLVLAQTVDESPELDNVLRERSAPIEALRVLVDSLLAGKAHPVTRELARRAVNARHRTYALTVRTYLAMAAEISGEKIARVVVARPLDDARLARLKAALTRQTGAPVVLQVQVDPSVLGGMSVQIDDYVIESTVAARLKDARRQLINL